MCQNLLYSTSIYQSMRYLIGLVAPSGPLSSEGGTGSHLKCRPQLKPPLTMGDDE